MMSELTRMQTVGQWLNSKNSAIHWIISDMRYNHVSDKQRAISKLVELRDAVDTAINVLSS